MKPPKELSAKTIKNVHGVFHRALEKAVQIGAIRVNPSDACTLPRVEPKEIEPLQDDDITAFLKAIKGDEYESLLIVDIFTGLRKSELLALTWDCVDFTKGTVLINKQLQKETQKGGKYYFAPLKNDKARTIMPADSIMRKLKERKRLQSEQRLLAGSAWDGGALPNLVFTNALGKHLCHVTVGRHFKKAVTLAGIPQARFHDMRHTYACVSIRNGDDVKTVQENLGHYSAAFTLDIYGHVVEQMRKDSAARMENFITSIEQSSG